MADFVQTTVNKTAVRDLAVPITDVESFNIHIQALINHNPIGCVGYNDPDRQTVDAVVRSREHYTAKVFYLSGEGKRVGSVSLLSPTIAAFNANAAEVLGNTALATAMGATAAVRDGPGETYYARLKCHNPSGDDYDVTSTRKTVRISSYHDDAIKNTVETWADDVTSLE
jgi:hypothetical protein